MRVFIVAALAAAVLTAMTVLPSASSTDASGRRWTVGSRQPAHTVVAAERVLAHARAGHRVRIIVGLRADGAYAPEWTLTEVEVLIQRASIRSAQAALLRAMAGFPVTEIRRFTIIPALSISVDAAALSALQSRPDVAYIEEDQRLNPAIAESKSITGVEQAWRNGYSGLGTSVAILDTGVDRFHPYFSHGRVVSEACYSTTSETDGSTALCLSGSTEPGAAAPCTNIAGCDHGTYVAAIAAADEDPSARLIPTRGVSPGATIVAMQVFSGFYGLADCPPDGNIPRPCIKAFESDVLAGLERVYELRTSFNIVAVNLSLSGAVYMTQAACDLDYPSFKTIFDTLRSVGIATVAAAGNDGRSDALSVPACISSAISVGSTTDGTYNTSAWPADLVSAFSDSASFLSLLAPGELIQFDGYGASLRGTSFAAPHVTGAWALLKGRFTTASVDDILHVLVSTGASITDPRNGSTKPRINVAEAIAAMGPPCTYAISPVEILVGHGGGATVVHISTQAGCPWTVFRHEFYVIPEYPASGSGSGLLQVTVTANPGTDPRTTMLDIVGDPLAIQQAGLPARRPVDLNGDRNLDLIWQHDGDGRIAAWLMSGATLIDGRLLSPQVADLSWKVVGVGDLDGDGFDDLVWQNVADGRVAGWFMNGMVLRDGALLGIPQVADLDWHIRAVSDANGDGRADLWWQHGTTGQLAVWLMNGVDVTAGMALTLPAVVDPAWQIAGAGDFDGDGNDDLVWHHEVDGRIVVWRMNGTGLLEQVATTPGQVLDPGWTIRGVGDLNRDGKPDLIWQNTSDGRVSTWLMDGLSLMDGRLLTPPQVFDGAWRIVGPK